MPSFTQDAIALGQDGFQGISTTQFHPLGQRGITKDGRVYRYCSVGAVDLVAGNVIQSSAILTTHLALTAVAAAIGATGPFVVTPGATAGAANLYAEGYLGVDTTPGNGLTYCVSGHPAITASTAFNLTLKQDDGIQTTAWTTATRYGLLAHPYKTVIQSPITTATGTIVGVAPVVIPASNFGWLQTAGIANVLINGTPALGAPVVGTSATAAGAADVLTTTNLVINPIIGHMAQIGVSGKNNFVKLQIAF